MGWYGMIWWFPARHGGTSIAGWFLWTGKCHRSKWMMTGGRPMTKRKPPYAGCNCSVHGGCKATYNMEDTTWYVCCVLTPSTHKQYTYWITETYCYIDYISTIKQLIWRIGASLCTRGLQDGDGTTKAWSLNSPYSLTSEIIVDHTVCFLVPSAARCALRAARTCAWQVDQPLFSKGLVWNVWVKRDLQSRVAHVENSHELLVGGLVAIFGIFPLILGIIIPIDELIFFRGVAQPPTRFPWTVISWWVQSNSMQTCKRGFDSVGNIKNLLVWCGKVSNFKIPNWDPASTNMKV